MEEKPPNKLRALSAKSAGREPLEDAVRDLLLGLGEDPNREGLLKTPERVAKSLEFLTQGYHLDAKAIINGAKFTIPAGECRDGSIRQRNLFDHGVRCISDEGIAGAHPHLGGIVKLGSRRHLIHGCNLQF